MSFFSKAFIFLFSVSALGAAPAVQTAPKKIPFPPALVEIEKCYAKETSLRVSFEQLIHSEAIGIDRKSSGIIDWKKPNLLRWETVKPDPTTLIHDGKFFWYYTPPFSEGEKGQLLKEKTNQRASALAIDLLSGKFQALKKFRTEKTGESEFAFFPKGNEAGDVSKIQITISDKGPSAYLSRIFLSHRSLNTTELKLSKPEFGAMKKLPNTHFRPDPSWNSP